MSENLTKATIDLLTAEFQEADLDETGYLTKSELKNAMLKKGKNLSGIVAKSLHFSFFAKKRRKFRNLCEETKEIAK